MSDDNSSNTKMILLQQKLDNHIGEYERHREAEDKRWNNLIVIQERNTKCITELTDSTRDLISAWQAANGTVKTMSAFGKFIKWLAGFAIVGTLIKWIIEFGK